MIRDNTGKPSQYNHAMACFNSGLLDKAYDSALNAFTNNPSHSSSHLILSKIMDAKNLRIKAKLPLYYFLLLEPHTERAGLEYATLRGYLDQGVSKTTPTKINISIPVASDSDF
ncbi:hypothetical protein [Robertkochia sediminum]|uniref:hypothetical protein n=1 Tax=Robertkochia sediminum TaxID=2785326 RepID=UPI001932D329|nr:hypothetical protein [Robertkochia sediminum]MBL7473251.1 hypothetical protein [Robertkochia sediminum]